MLEINTPYKNGDTVSFKLTSGEEIIGRLVEEQDTVYIIKKPMALVAGEKGIGLAPFMFSTEEGGDLRLQSHAVSCVAKTQKDLSTQYVAKTTGIAIN